jgi:hypothetical protein
MTPTASALQVSRWTSLECRAASFGRLCLRSLQAVDDSSETVD